MEAMELLPIILYICLIILVVASVVFIIKLIKIAERADKVLTDVDYKMNKLNGLFEVVDKTSGIVNLFSDKIVGIITTGFTTLFNKRKNRKEEE